tara:strand:+ start:411 stop:668 length:258 start_codon:yes stop_codon:yes gene_type:complete
MSAIGLGVFDRAFGFIFGGIKAISIIFIIIVLLEPLILEKTWWISSFTKEYYTLIKSFLDSNLGDWDSYLNLIGDKEGDPELPSV